MKGSFSGNYYPASTCPHRSVGENITSLRLSIFISFLVELVYKEASVSPVRHARSRALVLQTTAALKVRFIPVTSVAFVEPQELHLNLDTVRVCRGCIRRAM